jgi:hypothetical protein
MEAEIIENLNANRSTLDFSEISCPELIKAVTHSE